MNLYQILCLVGVPAIISTVTGLIVNKIQTKHRKNGTLERGVQALLRDRLYECFNKWIDKGYAPIYAKENFENMYTQYHSLGSNGVMDGLHDQFMSLPTERNSDEEMD